MYTTHDPVKSFTNIYRNLLQEYVNFFGGCLNFLWTNLTLFERVCIKEIIKINLTTKVSFELVKYEHLHQVRAKNRQRKGGHFGCTASVVVLFASFFFRQFSFCCLTGHSQSSLMLVKWLITTCKIWIIEINICLFWSKRIGSGSDADENVRLLLFTADLWLVKQRSCC